MSRDVPLYLFRFEFSIHGEPVAPPDIAAMLEGQVGKMVSHRKADPDDDDLDTFLFKVVDLGTVGAQRVLTWHVGRQVTVRPRTRYDRETDETVDELVRTDEVQFAKFVALPWHGVCATVDRTNERSLPAASAISRLKSVVSLIPGGELRITPAANSADLARALQDWKIESFTFTLRPFNPTIRKPGDKMDELLRADGIGVLSGSAKPAEAEAGMHDSTAGLMAEARGLSDHGYGQFGFTGRTPEGRRVAMPKPDFSTDKEKNLRQQANKRRLKVYIEEQGTVDGETIEIVRALIDTFGIR